MFALATVLVLAQGASAQTEDDRIYDTKLSYLSLVAELVGQDALPLCANCGAEIDDDLEDDGNDLEAYEEYEGDYVYPEDEERGPSPTPDQQEGE